jgi:hypothetical protein
MKSELRKEDVEVRKRSSGPVAVAILFLICSLACSTGKSVATPGTKFTAADVARLKWIEGTWRGMDGDKPFFERYQIEENALVVESFDDETFSSPTDSDRFELKNGEFGKGEGDKRVVASEISANHIQFVPAVPGKSNNFRFERQSDGTWIAVLDFPANGNKPARQKIYRMEPWPKK